MADTCFVLFASTGSYEEHQRWPVRVFADKADADNYARDLDQFAGEINTKADALADKLHGEKIDYDQYTRRMKRLRAPLSRLDKGDSDTGWERPTYDVQEVAFTPADANKSAPLPTRSLSSSETER